MSDRRFPVRSLTLAVALAAVLTSCGDDSNDGAVEQQRLADLVTESPVAAAAETEAMETTVVDGSAEDDGGPVETSQAVSPTGVIVPVQALDNSFRPEIVEIAVGDEVLWENRGMNEHDALYVDGDDWGVVAESFQPGDVYSHVFTEAGEYRYYCSIHGSTEVGMIGTVIVRG